MPACLAHLSAQTLGNMDFEKVLGFIALCWLVGSLLLMARSIRGGRDLAEVLANRYPDTYQALGRPRPGYLESVRRTRFAQFVGRREFEDLDDASLSSQFEAYRKSEARLILSILASGALVALFSFAIRHAA
jgi:hypothetical protein